MPDAMKHADQCCNGAGGVRRDAALELFLADIRVEMQNRHHVLGMAIASGHLGPYLRSELARCIVGFGDHVSYIGWLRWGKLLVGAFTKELAIEHLPEVDRLLVAGGADVHVGVAFSDDARDQDELLYLADHAWRHAVSVRRRMVVLAGAEARRAIAERPCGMAPA